MTGSRRAREWGLPLLSGLLLGATFTPFGGPFLPFVAFAPLSLALVRAPSPGAGLRAGFLTAVLAHGVGLYWMVPALAWRTSLAVPTYLLVLGLIGISAAAAVEAGLRLHRRFRVPLALSLAIVWVGFEWAAARVPGMPYAWLNAGASLAWYPELTGPARWLGASGLALWTVLVGASIGTAVARASLALRETLALAVVVLLPLIPGLGSSSLPGTRSERTVIGVQPGSGRGPREAGESFDAWTVEVARLAGEGGTDLVAFPERFLERPPAPGSEALMRLGLPVLFGAPEARSDGEGPDTLWYNAAWLAEPGEVGFRTVRKKRLVPGLEDGGAGVVSPLALPSRGYQPGRDLSLLDVAGWQVGVLICYDSAFPGVTRSLARSGAEVLVVLSNDDWLDPEGPDRSTVAYWQHETQGRLRAIESGLPLVQVATTGRTFSVDGRGRPVPAAGSGGTGGPDTLLLGGRPPSRRRICRTHPLPTPGRRFRDHRLRRPGPGPPARPKRLRERPGRGVVARGCIGPGRG